MATKSKKQIFSSKQVLRDSRPR